jgi:1-acyl-sn-glycerol-3-phosphate acyltransferase
MPQATAQVWRGSLAMLLYVINTIFWTSLLFLVAIPKVAIPVRVCQQAFARLSVTLASCWIWVNNHNLALVNRVRWEFQGLAGLKKDAWYLLVANHQSWTDIMVLQRAMLGQVPFLKFFIKKSLIWMPFLGQAWWVMDFPFLERYSKEQLRANPTLAKKDLRAISQACEKFKWQPTTVMVFAEGTRVTEAKRQSQQSPYVNLLKPKVGGIARTFKAMSGHLDAVLNVTVAYPQGVKGFWEFICSKHQTVRVHVEGISVNSLPFFQGGNWHGSNAQVQEWLNNLWHEKDRLLEEMKS